MEETRNYLSISQINMFLRCPMQYQFRYIDGIKIPPAGVMIQGSAYHKAVAADFINVRDTHNLLPLADVADIFSTYFDEQVHQKKSVDEGETWEFEAIDWEDRDPGEVKDEGIVLAILYHDTVAPTITPIEVENRLDATVESVNFVLIADVVTENTIIDHKLKKRRFSEDDLKRDLQATAYTYFYQKPFEFHQALKLKTPVIDIAKTERSKMDWKFFEMLVPKVWAAIKSGIFYPSPTGWHCSQDFCGYYTLCKGGY